MESVLLASTKSAVTMRMGKILRKNEEIKMVGLLPETKYNCTGMIVHTIPNSGTFETPWSDSVIIETSPAPTTTSAPEPEVETVSAPEPEAEADETSHKDAEQNIGEKAGDDGIATILALSITGICLAILAAGGCYWWHCIRGRGQKGAEVS